MRIATLIASITIALTISAAATGCGGIEEVPGPNTGSDPQPDPPFSYPDGGGTAPDSQAPPTTPPTTPPPAQGPSCAPSGQYNGTAVGSIDANIPLLGKQKMPVQCDVKFAVQGSGSAQKAVGTVQVIDPKTQKPWVYAPKPFTFNADVKCNKLTGPLKGNIAALGMNVAFTGSIEGTWDGSTFKGKWTGGAVSAVTAQGGGTWNAKR